VRPIEALVSRITDVVVTAVACMAGLVLVFLMLMTTAGVVGRKFGIPINGVFDLTHFTVLIMTFFGMAYCGYRGSHVSIELLYQHLGRRTRNVLNRAINLLGCVLFAVIAWQTFVQSYIVREINESSQLLEIPYFPFYWMVAFGAGLFAFVMGLRVFVPEPEGPGDGGGEGEGEGETR
jgi:TRAP-type C4-dicarboxylate transport system permease small subunit